MVADRQAQALRVVVLKQLRGVQADFDGGRIAQSVALKVNQPRHLLDACALTGWSSW